MTEPTDAELIALLGDRQFSTIGAVREALRRWGTPPAVAGEPVAWLSTDCIGERYLCFTKPKDSNPARPLVFGDTTPRPTQPQAGAVPLTDGQAKEVLWSEHLRWMRAAGLDTEGMCPTGEWLDHWLTYVRAIERAHGIGIKGGQHGTE